MKTLFYILFFFLNTFLFSQLPVLEWANSIHNNNNGSYSYALAADKNKNVYTANS